MAVEFGAGWWANSLALLSDASHMLTDAGSLLFSLFVGLVTFTLLYVWLVLHRQRVMAMEDAIEERGLD